MKIGVDIDDVLASFMIGLIEYHNKTYATAFARDDFKSFDLSKTWGGTTEEAIDRVFGFYESPSFKDVGVIEGAREAIRELKKNHELAVVTARPEILREATTDWLNRHFPDMFSEIHIANKFSKVGPQLTKRELCDTHNIEILIDDSFDNAVQCVTDTRHVLLFNAPWNQEIELPERIKRVHSWGDVLKHINET